jgi:hypothetical protein
VQLPDDTGGHATQIAHDDATKFLTTNRTTHWSSSANTITRNAMRGNTIHRAISFLCPGLAAAGAPTLPKL